MDDSDDAEQVLAALDRLRSADDTVSAEARKWLLVFRGERLFPSRPAAANGSEEPAAAVPPFAARRAALRRLMDCPRIARQLQAAMEDDRAEVREDVTHLIEVASPRVAEEPLVRHMLSDPCWRVRWMCGAALLTTRLRLSPLARDAYLRAAEDPNERVAFQACIALAGVTAPDGRVVDALQSLARRPYELTRSVACRALVWASAADEAIVGILHGLVQSQDWNTRLGACAHLVELGAADVRVVEALEGLVDLPEAERHDRLAEACAAAAKAARAAGRRPRRGLARLRTRRELLEEARKVIAARDGRR